MTLSKSVSKVSKFVSSKSDVDSISKFDLSPLAASRAAIGGGGPRGRCAAGGVTINVFELGGRYV